MERNSFGPMEWAVFSLREDLVGIRFTMKEDIRFTVSSVEEFYSIKTLIQSPWNPFRRGQGEVETESV